MGVAASMRAVRSRDRLGPFYGVEANTSNENYESN
jgi:hypothetical protein